MLHTLKECVENLELCIPTILVNSYLYYIKDTSGSLNDYDFDKLCRFTLTHFDEIEHEFKPLIDIDALSCGSLYHLTAEDYPSDVVYAAEVYLAGGADQE